MSKIKKAFLKALKFSPRVTIPGIAGAAISLVIRGAFEQKAAKIKKGGISTKKTRKQITTNKRASMLRKAKAASAKKRAK